MANDENVERKIIDLWQGQPTSAREPNMEIVIASAQKFQRKVRLRNWTEYVACGVLLVWTTDTAIRSAAPPLVKIGSILLGLGALIVALILRLRGHAAAGEPPLAAPTRELMRWHRAELVRQRDLLRGVPVWYLGPFVPGVVVLLVGSWLASPGQGLSVGLEALVVAAVFAGVALLNLRAAKKLDARIEELGDVLEG